MTIDATTTSDTTTTNKWLTGLNAPVTEEVTAVRPGGRRRAARSSSTGATCATARTRSGPSTRPRTTGSPATRMVHGVRLRDGQGRVVPQPLGALGRRRRCAGRGPPSRASVHGGMDTANTNVIGHRRAHATPSSRPAAARSSCRSSWTRSRHSDLGGTLPHGYTAHPKVDPATGDVHAIAYHWALPHLQYIVIGADGLVRQVEPIEVDDGPMVHDCSITERWMVVYDLPGRVRPRRRDARRALPVLVERDPRRPRRARAARRAGERRALVRRRPVLRRSTPSTPTTTATASCSTSCATPRCSTPTGSVPTTAPPQLWRWTIDTVTGQVREEQLTDVPLEFPRVDERVVGRRHRYGYATEVGRADGGNGFGGRLVRIDGATGDAVADRPRPGPAVGGVGHGAPARRRGRGRRLADEPRLRPRPPTAATSSCCRPPTRSPAPSPRCSCPAACRWASTATGSRPSDVRAAPVGDDVPAGG